MTEDGIGSLRTHSFNYHSANPILYRFALNRSCPVRKRLSWTHALRAALHPVTIMPNFK